MQKEINDSKIGENDEDLACRLLLLDSFEAKIRIFAEILMEIGAVLYIIAALREARFLGIPMFIENLVS